MYLTTEELGATLLVDGSVECGLVNEEVAVRNAGGIRHSVKVSGEDVHDVARALRAEL